MCWRRVVSNWWHCYGFWFLLQLCGSIKLHTMDDSAEFSSNNPCILCALHVHGEKPGEWTRADERCLKLSRGTRRRGTFPAPRRWRSPTHWTSHAADCPGDRSPGRPRPVPAHHDMFSWHQHTRQLMYFWNSAYDTTCYFNVRSKADTNQLNLPHGTKNWNERGIN